MDFSYALAYICTILACIHLYRLLFRKTSTVGNLPPGPRPLPVVGSLLKLGSRPNETFAELALTHGPLMTLQLGQVTAVVISSAEVAKEALQKKDQAFAGRGMVDGIRIIDYPNASMVWAEHPNQAWRNFRMLCSKWIFSSARLDANQGLRQEKAKELVVRVANIGRRGLPVNVGTVAFATMVNMISNTMFSVDLVDLESETAQEFKDLVWRIMEDVGKPNLVDYFPFLRAVDPQGIRRRTTIYFQKVFDIFERLIQERLVQRASPKYQKKKDFLEALLDLKDNGDATQISRHEMKGLFTDLFLAGSETSSVTVEWAMAELLRNPEIMIKITMELNETIGPKKQVEESDISHLPYLRAVVKETLRVHPPAPLLLPHKIESDVEISGFTIPKSTQVFINAWAIARSPSTWADPCCFRPERFLESNIDFRGRDFEFIPFGAGRRICPGLALSDRMSHLMLASLVHSFAWKLPEDMQPQHLDMRDKFGVTLQKHVPLLAIPIIREQDVK